MNEATWRKGSEIPLMIASFAYLVAYSWRVIGDLNGPGRVLATTVITVTWAMFLIDYVVRLLMAQHKMVWFRTHLADLAFALIPVLRLVLLLTELTKLPGIRSTAGDRLRVRIMVYSIGASVILIYVSSLAVLETERHAPGATITTFGVAVWWACVTVTTTGYGDYVPVTDAGRTVASALMFGGVALSGIITASLASWVLERAAHNRDEHEPASRAQMREVIAKVDALMAASRSGDPDAGARDVIPPSAGEPRHETDVESHGDLGNGGDDRPGG